MRIVIFLLFSLFVQFNCSVIKPANKGALPMELWPTFAPASTTQVNYSFSIYRKFHFKNSINFFRTHVQSCHVLDHRVLHINKAITH